MDSCGVYGPFYPAKHCPFHSLCLGLALSPTCPAPLVSSLISWVGSPALPLLPPALLSTTSSGLSILEQVSPVITSRALCLPPALRNSKCHACPISLNFQLSPEPKFQGHYPPSRASLLSCFSPGVLMPSFLVPIWPPANEPSSTTEYMSLGQLAPVVGAPSSPLKQKL